MEIFKDKRSGIPSLRTKEVNVRWDIALLQAFFTSLKIVEKTRVYSFIGNITDNTVSKSFT
jgi:hypothetical protein